MKYLKLFAFISVLFCMYNICLADNQNNDNNHKILSLNEIDLLVGTPEGVAEPLDSRRNVITKDNSIDYSSFLDENAISSDNRVILEWEDAEDSSPSESQVENQLMDLLAETEELEKIDEIYYQEEKPDNASSSEKISLKNFEQDILEY